MTLRSKTLLVMGVTFVGWVAAFYVIFSTGVLKGFVQAGKPANFSTSYFFFSLASALVFSLASVLLVEYLVLSRLARLDAQLKEISDGSHPLARVSVTGGDELSSLAGEINRVLEILERSQAELQRKEHLFEKLVTVARATAECPTLEATLQNALDASTALTGAEHGSLFLLDSSAKVAHSVLSPNETSAEKRWAIINQVMADGAAGWVSREHQAILIADTHDDERWVSLPDQAYARSALIVPLLSGSTLIGILSLLHSQPGHFDSEHLYLMQAAVDQMVLAVRNAQIFDAQLRQASRQITLYEILRAMSGELDPEAVARVAVDAIVKFAGWPNVAILLPTEDTSCLVTMGASSILSTMVGNKTTTARGVVGRAFRSAQVQRVADVSLDPDYVTAHPGMRSELAVPIQQGGQVLGVLNLESELVGDFDTEDVLLAESLAEIIALALSSAKLYAETRKYAADLSALYAVARAISRSLDWEEDVFSQALSLALTLLDFEAGFIALSQPDGEDRDGLRRPQTSRPASGLCEENPPQLQLVTEQGLPLSQLESMLDSTAWTYSRDGALFRLMDTLGVYVQDRRESVLVGDLEQEAPESMNEVSAEIVAQGWRACAGIPLLHQEQSLGVMCLFAHQPRLPSAYDLALLTTVGHQVATAVTNSRLFKATLTERSRLQALIKSSRDGVIMVGMNRRILVLNAPALHLLNLPGQPEDWLNCSLIGALNSLRHRSPALTRTLLAEVRRIQKGDEPAQEGEYVMQPRTVHWLNLPVLSGAVPLGRLIVLRDVSDERALERLREDMTHTMVHDLRSPLSAIFSAIEFFRKETADTLSSDHLLILEIVRKSTRKMLELVNGILEVNQLESGRMAVAREPFALAEIVAEVLQLHAAQAAEVDIRLESDVPATLPAARADAGLIRRVLQNLLGNAIKFTPPGGVIRVTGRAEERKDAPVLYVSVCDTGSGVPPQILGRLFQKFVTGPQRGRGSGLGLAFCKLAIEAHGERIWVEKSSEEGTTFTFSLPVAAS